MPVFTGQRSFRPSGGINPSGDVETPGRIALAALLGIPTVKLPPVSAVPGGDPLMVLPEGAAISIMADANPVVRFRRDYCQVPPGGFASQAALDAWSLSHSWCPIPAGPITSVPGAEPRSMREELRIRLGLLAANMPTAAELPDSAVSELLSNFASGPVGDTALRQKFQNLYCVLPSAPLTTNEAIDAWNLAHRWCVPIPRLTIAVTAGGRSRLQTQLGLTSLPSVIDLTDATADAILALPAAQMVDAFRARFCNPPTFGTAAARDLWISQHPYCPNPPPVSMARSPVVWIAGVAAVGAGLWWVLKKSKKTKA
jgi:hypothetical protein